MYEMSNAYSWNLVVFWIEAWAFCLLIDGVPKRIEFVHMAGSRGKHSKNKGKSKSRKSNAVDKKSERCDCNKKRAKNCCGWPESLEGDGPHICAMVTCRSNYTDYEVAELLYTKIEYLFTDAKFELSKLGHSERDIEMAILRSYYLGGPTDYLLDNIMIHSLAFLEGKVNSSEERKHFATMRELYDHVVKILVNGTLMGESTMTVPDAMWHLLLAKWPTGMYPRNQGITKVADPVESSSSFQKGFYKDTDSDCDKIPFYERINMSPSLKDHMKKNVITLAADIRRRLSNISEQDSNEHDSVMKASEVDPDSLDYIKSSYAEEFLNGLPESGSGNPQIARVSDLIVAIKNLEEEVKRSKELAQQKVILAEKEVSQNLLEMNLLRMEGDASKKVDELKHAKRYVTLNLIETEQNLRRKMYEADLAAGIRSLEHDNAQIRSEIEAANLCLGISSRDLEDAVKRERRCPKKAKDLDEQCRCLQEQCDEDKIWVHKLQQELQQIEKDAMETEMQLMQEMQKKEQMLTCLSEEVSMAEMQKSNSRAELSKLRKKLEIDSQVIKDERRRLEDELSKLRVSVEMQDLSLVDNFSSHEAICPDEEVTFLRSLGWEENEGEEDQGLTEDEIKEFYEKYMPYSGHGF